MWNFIYSLFVLCSIAYVPYVKEEFWIVKNAVFVVGVFMVLAISLMSTKRYLTFSNRWLAGILIFTALSFGWFFFVPIVFATTSKINWQIWNYLPTLNIFVGVILLKTMVENTDSKARWVNFSKVLCWMGCIFSAYVILQKMGVDQIFSDMNGWAYKRFKVEAIGYEDRVVSFLGNSFLSGNYIAIIAPLNLMFKQLRYKIFYVLAWCGAIACNSAISLLALSLSLLAYLLITKSWKKAVCFILILLAFGGYKYKTDKDNFSFTGRDVFWKVAYDGWRASYRPFTGNGIGSFAAKNYMIGNKNTGIRWLAHAHNEFIQILHDGGLILLILTFGFLTEMMFGVFRRLDNIMTVCFLCGFISFLLIAFAGFPLRIAPLAFLGLIYTGYFHTIKGETNV